MKVLFDNQIFLSQKYGGISRYFFEMFREFESLNKDYEVPIKYSNNEYIKDLINCKTYKDHRVLNKFFYLLGKSLSTKHIKKSDFDIFHPTYYDPYFLKSLKKPYVLTVYDFMHEKFSDMFSPKDKNIEWKKECTIKADRVIAISENTKKDIIEYYGVSEDKIDVVYLASSLAPISHNLTLEIPKDYILFVGNRGRYKNFRVFIESIVPLIKENSDLYVVCAGGGSFAPDEVELLRQLGVENKVLQYYIDDEILAYLYQNAMFFVFPSLYEGFGIPVLEAFNCNCPVALSNQGSLPEVGGNAVEYFDPYSKESMYESISNLYKSSQRREELKQLASKEAEKFSWRKTAEETIAVYNKI
jgi:glycosyltransferase involved in cell wall biosynthesis